MVPLQTEARSFLAEFGQRHLHCGQFFVLHQGHQSFSARGFDGFEIGSKITIPIARRCAPLLLAGAERQTDDSAQTLNREDANS